MKSNLKHVLQIGEASSDPKIKLEARRIANEIAKNIMDQVTGGVICTRAFELAIQKQEQINTLQKIDERIEAMGEEKTTEGVY